MIFQNQLQMGDGLKHTQALGIGQCSSQVGRIIGELVGILAFFMPTAKS